VNGSLAPIQPRTIAAESTMPTNETAQIAEALKALTDRFSADPRVEGTMIELDTDEAGDPSAVITVILAEDTSDNDWTSAKLEPIAEYIRSAVRVSGVSRYPYVRFAKWSDVPNLGGFGPDERVWKRVG
jgi:hypothetical protein